jgi:hypothetical protein
VHVKETTVHVDDLSMSNQNQIMFAGESFLIAQSKVVRLEKLLLWLPHLYSTYRVISVPIHFPTGTEQRFATESLDLKALLQCQTARLESHVHEPGAREVRVSEDLNHQLGLSGKVESLL